MERLLIFNVNISSIECLIQKPVFAVNLPLKLIPAVAASVDTGMLKSLCKLLITYLDNILAKFVTNRIVQNVQNSEVLDKNPTF